MWIKYNKRMIKVDYIELVEENGKHKIQTMFNKYVVELGSYTKKKATEIYNEIVKAIQENKQIYEMPQEKK